VGINSKTVNLEASLKFVKYITGKEAVIDWYLSNGIPPARFDAFKELSDSFDNPIWKIFIYEMNNTSLPRPVTPGYSQYELILREAFSSIHYGADPQKTLEDASKRIDRELQRYK